MSAEEEDVEEAPPEDNLVKLGLVVQLLLERERHLVTGVVQEDQNPANALRVLLHRVKPESF